MPNRIKLPVLIIKIVYKKLFIIKDFSTSDADIGVTKESSKTSTVSVVIIWVVSISGFTGVAPTVRNKENIKIKIGIISPNIFLSFFDKTICTFITVIKIDIKIIITRISLIKSQSLLYFLIF